MDDLSLLCFDYCHQRQQLTNLTRLTLIETIVTLKSTRDITWPLRSSILTMKSSQSTHTNLGCHSSLSLRPPNELPPRPEQRQLVTEEQIGFFFPDTIQERQVIEEGEELSLSHAESVNNRIDLETQALHDNSQSRTSQQGLEREDFNILFWNCSG